MKKTLTVSIALLAAIVMLAACTPQTGQKQVTTPVSTFTGGDDMKKFSSRQEILDFLKENSGAGSAASYGGIGRSGGIMMETAMAAPPMAKSADAAASSSASGAGAAGYSRTNVQVEGVDEADFVKNDGKYIYAISGNKLVIVDAFPAEDAGIVSETKIDGYSQQLFVNGDHLVAFVNRGEEVPSIAKYDIIPRPAYQQRVHALLYDISDRSDPKLLKDYNLAGNFLSARMIGDYVYFIAQDGVRYYTTMVDVPVVKEASSIAVQPDIFYFPQPEDNYNFNTVMSFNIKDESEEPQAKSFMMGWASTVYVSEDAIYIAYQKNYPYRYYEQYNEERFYDVIVPLLPSDARDSINGIKGDGSLNADEKWDRISSVLEDMYNAMDEGSKEDFVERMQKAIREYEVRKDEERRKTVIHKIAIDDGDLEYVAKGEVKGYLLNQFSLDEHEGRLRVATTFDSWAADDYVQYNSVYVLDGQMDLAGSLERIAPDERIYSTRFIGDRLYMVTFKRVDPFFVIDLSGTDPRILGELKLPGFSDYLHPYDGDHIIGVGKETAENEWGGVSTKGIKIALFDVSDVSNPKNQAVYSIGEAGTDSEALNDHKAFLFDKEKSLLVLPVREIRGEAKYDPRYGYYRQNVWQGAYVLGLTPEDGFTLKGKVTHSEGDEQQWGWYGSPSAVRRALYMDDILYTVSGKYIKANGLEDMEEVATVKLPYEGEQPYPYPVPMASEGVMAK